MISDYLSPIVESWIFPFGRIKEYLQTFRIKIADSSHTLLIRTLILVALLVSPGLAQAGDIYLLINGHSEHFGDAPDGSKLNEKNYGVGLQYEISENKRLGLKPFVTLSIFKDSNSNWSGYAGGGYLKRFKISNNGFHVDMGVAGFLMVRKRFNRGMPFPGALPFTSFGTNRISINVTYIPKLIPDMVPLWFFQLKVRI